MPVLDGDFEAFVDYERFGRDVAMDESGGFADEGYIRNTGDSWDQCYDGSHKDIPDEYRITGSGEEQECDSKITILIVEPGKEPYAKEIDSSLGVLAA